MQRDHMRCSRVPQGVLSVAMTFCVAWPGLAAAAPGAADVGDGSALGDAEAPSVDPANYKMVLAGDIVTGVGGAALVMMLVGLVIRSDASAALERASLTVEADAQRVADEEQRLAVGSALAISGGALTVALFTTGVTLIVLGRRRERLRREQLSYGQLSPRIEPGSVGLSWKLRF